MLKILLTCVQIKDYLMNQLEVFLIYMINILILKYFLMNFCQVYQMEIMS